VDERNRTSPETFAAHIPNAFTRRTRLRSAQQFVAWAEAEGIDVLSATTPQVVGYVDALRETHAQSTCMTVQRSLRAYFTWLEQSGFIVRSPLAHVRDDKQDRGRPPKHISPEDLRKMLDASTTDRNWSFLAIMAFSSLRISELIACNVEDFESRDGVHILHFKPSGGGEARRRPNFTVLADEVAEVLSRQIGERRRGPLFLSRQGSRMTRPSASNSVFLQTAERAGLSYPVRPEMVTNCLPVAALKRGFSYRGMVRAIGVPDRRFSERWIGFTDGGPAEDNASLRLARLVFDPPDSAASMLMHVESILNETDLPDAFAAMTACAVFERHLYELCIAHDLDVPTERKDGRINKYVHELRRSGVFTLADQKLTEGIAEARNNAAHGAFDLLSPSAGRDVLRNVRKLVEAHPLPVEESSGS
jgi:integrase